MVVLVGGDKNAVESKIKELPFAKDVVALDAEGKPLPASGDGSLK
jgi:hypothetical protein